MPVSRVRVVAVVLAAVAAVIALGTSPSDAGGAAPLTVVKEIVGTPPPGTQFVVEFQCVNDNNTLEEVVFDEFGDPIGPATTFFDGPDECLVVETQTGGAASVSYECEGTIPPPLPDGEPPVDGSFESPDPQGGTPTDPCDEPGPTLDPITVFVVSPGQEAAVTVTNTFAPPPPPPPPEPAPVVVEPRFTG